MVDGKTVREDMQEEKARLKKMNFSQKTEHIWAYYKIPIISVIILIAAAFGIIYTYRMNDYETALYTVIIDGKLDGIDEHKDALTTGFTKYLGIDGKSTRVLFDNNYTLRYTSNIDQDPYLSAEKLYTQIATGSIDALIATRGTINGFSTDEESSLLDLSDLLEPDELMAVSDHIIFYTLKDGTKIPNALSLSGTKVVEEMGLTVEDPCFGIVISSAHVDNAVAFIRFAFDLQ